MRKLICIVFLTVVVSGCVIGQDPVSTTTNTDVPTTSIYEQPAETPIYPKTPSSVSPNATKIELEIHRLVNEIRKERGLTTLKYDKRLAAIGRYHSWDMANNDYFSHNNSKGLTFDLRHKKYDYECGSAGENIALIPGPLDLIYAKNGTPLEKVLAREIVAGWMNSPDHRENILADDYKVEGLGVFISREGHLYASQELCG